MNLQLVRSNVKLEGCEITNSKTIKLLNAQPKSYMHHLTMTIVGLMTSSTNKNFLIRNLNDPYTKDWIFWLWIISVAYPLAINYSNSEGTFNLVAGLIDTAVAFFGNWFVFNWIPRTIRLKVRKRNN